MFFFIGGIQPKTVHVDKQPRICPSCGKAAVYLKRTDSCLSLFFVPLFPVKRGAPFLLCRNCGYASADGPPPVEGKASSNQRMCRYCGKKAAPDFYYCPYCGKIL